MSNPLLSVENLETSFHTSSGNVRAVRGVSFDLESGEVAGIVGESGSGKSVTSMSLMRLIAEPPGKVSATKLEFDGRDILRLSPAELRDVRGGGMSMIFQDPFSSLNPTMTLGNQVIEAILAHGNISKSEAKKKALQLFEDVRIPLPEIRMKQYPHQISGGQRQRVMIAMAFSTNPKLLIADEPTTALDVTVQAQIMSLMKDFQAKTGAAILLITHDLGVVAEMCDRVFVMYAGQIVEQGSVEQIFNTAQHPYTVGLLMSLPQLSETRHKRLQSIPGQPPDLAHLPTGCPFADRCEHAQDLCRQVEPGETDMGSGQKLRCHFPIELSV
ncbi:MAG: ABC transporter ATP-binding protein [Chthonomonadales bacterium]